MATPATKTTVKSDAKQQDAKIESTHTTASKVRVTRTVKLTGEAETSSSSEETLEVHNYVTKPAVAKAGLDIKMSMDYQSLGFSVGVELPCYTEELKEAQDRAYEMVFERLQAKIPEIQETLMKITGRSNK
jgi:hypothetical protein